ncbi:cobalt ABC transporter substrate-bindng protein [Pseudoxanthomonas broegbernensis]|uniref:Cobalt ABC transporter substrate-bindng protein n=1 Tax=Pseudoxanthomonas broegbernensis TaxID=83619 RepID=A0A7V8K7J1_9GAMM|nr:DUF4198 domain-containing protein [Pseudoxanthomonas broegbernensis]KAF1686641.1 cobalt ABC transporter substrate-bindng protein [Pseudoxanthomonas broegbernensis]MBB6063603.1 putative GH25 family protein [Pseudoxanthomonas broegbernensis]
MKLSPSLALAVAALFPAVFLPGTLQAHTPYLAPSEFAPRAGSTVTLDASFAETFFVPEVAFDNGSFEVTGPDGARTVPDTVQVLKTRTVVEHRLVGAGTYRVGTGHRLGAVFRTWELDGKTQGSRDAAQPLPAGAKLLSHFQSRTRAETYLTVGAPDRAALRPHGEGLELVPLTHPGDLYAGERFEFEVRFDGRPLADHKVEIVEAVWTSDRKPAEVSLLTDAQGRAAFNLDRPGTWVALVRHRAPAPAGAAAPEYSHGYTLTFRVLEQ